MCRVSFTTFKHMFCFSFKILYNNILTNERTLLLHLILNKVKYRHFLELNHVSLYYIYVSIHTLYHYCCQLCTDQTVKFM